MGWVKEHAPAKGLTRKATALTDNQHHTVPHAMLINIVILQQRSTYELQVWVHEPLSDNLEALNGVELQQESFIPRQARLTNKRVPSF